MSKLRETISSLNFQQRRIFDDLTERAVSSDINEKPVYLYLAGNAGTGKSFLVNVLIEAVKIIKLKAGTDLKKPPVIVMAPTANAAFIIGGKTIDSAFGFTPMDKNRYTEAKPTTMAMMKFQYEDVHAIFCDEISMVGASKLAKINYRLQDLANGDKKNEYMGGISFIAIGDFWQLPPIYDNIAMDKPHLDGRLECAPSHWKQHFRIFYLTEKMRSQKDPYFSDLCDRVARNTITEQDEAFLKSRIKKTESETENQNFKEGKICIIVTTNKKRDFENHKKLAELLPNEKEYFCNSVDRFVNLPGKAKIPERMQDNPGNTGNLQKELRLKVGAPVVITTNHPKQKYKDDGIMNGARGFVQFIQVSKDNPEKVDIIWVVFHRESIGRRYRADHVHLRKSFYPGHERATPILPQRKHFKLKFGNAEYQRTNFPLTLAYALTSHKCQGDTLDEVIIDFGADPVNKIKNYICPGGFYVALTRVKMGSKVYLRSFEKSFIKENKSIGDKVDAMQKFRQYSFKKIYLDETIFQNNGEEIKAGYLNINGLIQGNHGLYLNSDHNLKHLDILVLAETKLDKSYSTETLSDVLSDWKILRRYDAEDGSKHMGLMLLSSKHSNTFKSIKGVTYQKAKRNESLQIQGLVVRFSFNLNIGFIYCRSTPSNSEILAVGNNFKECDILMGDLNLSHRNKEDYQKVLNLCRPNKVNALSEITRPMSQNQLDYILVDKKLKEHTFVTSYNNFISDHNSIIVRLSVNGDNFTEEIKMRINFNSELHLKSKDSATLDDIDQLNEAMCEEVEDNSEIDEAICEEPEINSEMNEAMCEVPEDNYESLTGRFKRKFHNPDMSTCWLNSCLQLVLIAMDHSENNIILNSELGLELLRLQAIKTNLSLDPSNVKDIIASTEDTRVASRLSRLLATNDDEDVITTQSRIIEESRFNLRSGQQCVRDFFICLSENILDWPDVYSIFSFKTTHSSKCLTCGHENSLETTQSYIEMHVPANDTDMKTHVEDYLNEGSTRLYNCEEGCKKMTEKMIKLNITNTAESQFITVVLNRGIHTLDGYKFLNNRVDASKDIYLR